MIKPIIASMKWMLAISTSAAFACPEPDKLLGRWVSSSGTLTYVSDARHTYELKNILVTIEKDFGPYALWSESSQQICLHIGRGHLILKSVLHLLSAAIGDGNCNPGIRSRIFNCGISQKRKVSDEMPIKYCFG